MFKPNWELTYISFLPPNSQLGKIEPSLKNHTIVINYNDKFFIL
jgi:hypothetical protein